MKVLIAEDDSLSRLMLGNALERAGYEVIAVEDGDHALKGLKRNPPQLALLDSIRTATPTKSSRKRMPRCMPRKRWGVAHGRAGG